LSKLFNAVRFSEPPSFVLDGRPEAKLQLIWVGAKNKNMAKHRTFQTENRKGITLWAAKHFVFLSPRRWFLWRCSPWLMRHDRNPIRLYRRSPQKLVSRRRIARRHTNFVSNPAGGIVKIATQIIPMIKTPVSSSRTTVRQSARRRGGIVVKHIERRDRRPLELFCEASPKPRLT